MTKKTSQATLDIFRQKLSYCSEYGINFSGYSQRRLEEVLKELYGSWKYKIDNQTNIYIKNDAGIWFHLCGVEMKPKVKKEVKKTTETEVKTIADIVETHAKEYLYLEGANDNSIACYFRDNPFYKPQLFSVPSVGLNYKKASKECNWTIETEKYKKIGVQIHKKAVSSK